MSASCFVEVSRIKLKFGFRAASTAKVQFALASALLHMYNQCFDQSSILDDHL